MNVPHEFKVDINNVNTDSKQNRSAVLIVTHSVHSSRVFKVDSEYLFTWCEIPHLASLWNLAYSKVAETLLDFYSGKRQSTFQKDSSLIHYLLAKTTSNYCRSSRCMVGSLEAHSLHHTMGGSRISELNI